MKRKIAFILMLSCIVLEVIAAPSSSWPLFKNIHIQGGYASVASIKVTPIASQAEAYKIGMPFSIDDPSVQNGKTDKGRLIANWSTLANFQMLLDIDAEVMHHYSEASVLTDAESTAASGGYKTGLGYVLNFVYNISYATGSSITYKKLEFPIAVSTTKNGQPQKSDSFNDIDLLNGATITPGSLVGNAEGQIFFHFDALATQKIKDEFASLPNGNYLATVKIKMKVAN